MPLKNSKIIVIKIGSSLLVDGDKKVRTKWLSSFGRDIKKLKDDAQTQIQVEKDKAISEIREEVVTLTISVAEKVISKNLSSDENLELIEKSIKGLREYEA